MLKEIEGHEVVVGPTTCFSSVYFSTSLEIPVVGGGLEVRAKDQDFAISKKLFLKASHDATFSGPATVTKETHIGFVVAECKTNLDKTMFQEACATAHDVKAVGVWSEILSTLRMARYDPLEHCPNGHRRNRSAA